jgi:hypothetical protein
MNHILFIFLAFVSSNIALSTSNWSGSGCKDKQDIHFYGTLETHQGKKESIDNILVLERHNDIGLYDAPEKYAESIFNQKTKQTEIRLDLNPHTEFVRSKIDLKTVDTIKVPEPNTIWVYQQQKRNARQEFLLVQITFKEDSSPKKYLLEHKAHISCTSLDKNNAQKKEVPLAAIDTLTIEGYAFTLPTDKKKNVKKEVHTECPMITKETETTTEVIVK